MIRHLPLAISMAVVLVCSSGCYVDHADGYNATATVTANDGTTPLAGFHADSYEVIFNLNDGMNVARTYTTSDVPASTSGILTDDAGKFGISKTDVDLYTVRTETECYDTCVDWSTDCYYDQWDNYVCDDYCSWYTTD